LDPTLSALVLDTLGDTGRQGPYDLADSVDEGLRMECPAQAWQPITSDRAPPDRMFRAIWKHGCVEMEVKPHRTLVVAAGPNQARTFWYDEPVIRLYIRHCNGNDRRI
jgi:hypothetical protein